VQNLQRGCRSVLHSVLFLCLEASTLLQTAVRGLQMIHASFPLPLAQACKVAPDFVDCAAEVPFLAAVAMLKLSPPVFECHEFLHHYYFQLLPPETNCQNIQCAPLPRTFNGLEGRAVAPLSSKARPGDSQVQQSL
jgi:hypothetical protein